MSTITRLLAASLGALLLVPGTAAQAEQGTAARAEQDVAACAAASGPGRPEPLKATTIATIKQAYNCIFDHYYDSKVLDGRKLLVPAFAAFAQELYRNGRDRVEAVMPALTGDREGDWDAFSAVYQRVTGLLPDDAALRQALAAATLDGMIRALGDNHARWQRTELPPGSKPGQEYGLGIATFPSRGTTTGAPQQALPPLYVRSVLGGSAAEQGLRPGDIIEAVNGAPPFAGGVLSAGAVNMLYPQYPQTSAVRLKLRRPATSRTWTVTVKPTLYEPKAEAVAPVTAKLLNNGIAYVRLTGFSPKAADTALKAITDLGKAKGVVIDLRGNRGGSPEEANRLLGAFAHGKVTAYLCDAAGTCNASRTDDSVPLLHLPLAVLTDRDCASACDHFTSAVRAHSLGTLVGTRTAGVISGPSSAYPLDDNSVLLLPALYHLGPNREVINRIGTPPHHYVPMTAKDVSTGRDPVLAKALTVLAD
ncbi:S41 family peptidase [Nonomuraea sp. H19]|uniref:S41 family peptidase n=1 Tax=Nonomuraea sp. H19 TaxID=3452206 RepID=UPI003F8C61BC